MTSNPHEKDKDSAATAATSTKTIHVGYITRVEGEGALYLKMDAGVVTDVQLRIFEPPRFFEAFLRGRSFDEAPDVTARICGICPVAYQMSAVHAMEYAAGVRVPGHVKDLRRLLYCGEWIESHVLHIFMLHAPDFLGFPSAIAMAPLHGERIKKSLFMKKTGNAIVSLLGGREVHPINVRVGGFYKLPAKERLTSLLVDLKRARAEAEEAISWVSTFNFPDFRRDYELVSLKHDSQYPMNEGRIVSNKGLDFGAEEYESYIVEQHAPYSNALQAVIRGRGSFLCGPLARFHHNYENLPSSCRSAAQRAGIDGGTFNPYKSIIVRAIEVLFAFEEAIQIVESLMATDALANKNAPMAYVDVRPHGETGYAATEAPRGILYHRYGVNGEGLIEDAKIIPPTSQNQLSIEEDLRSVVPSRAGLPDDKLQVFCEQTIRNYDPCISCATHFIKITKVPGASWPVQSHTDEC